MKMSPSLHDTLAEVWADRYKVPQLPSERELDLMLSKTKGRLFFKKRAGFLGTLLCTHRFVWDLTAPTAWCNGTTIGFNPYFFVAMTAEGRVTVLGHELWHTGFDHMGRLAQRDPTVWNHAGDYVINWEMNQDGFSFDPADLAGIHPLLDNQYSGMTTEQVYDLLIQNAPPPPPTPCAPDPNGDDQDPGDSPTPPSGSQDPFAAAHGDPRQVKGLDGDLRAPVSSAHERMANIVRAKQTEQRSLRPGSIPGEIETILEKFLNPILPWEKLLRNHLTELSQDDYSWRRPSRRSQDEYLPSLIGDNALEYGAFYTDVSGSITDKQMLRSNSEAKSVFDEFNPERLTLCTFDTQIQNVVELYQDDSFDSLKITGRGGTSLVPVFEDIKQRQPSVAVIFSDMYVREIPPNPGIPVIWIIIENTRPEYMPSYGKIIHLSEEQI